MSYLNTLEYKFKYEIIDYNSAGKLNEFINKYMHEIVSRFHENFYNVPNTNNMILYMRRALLKILRTLEGKI